MYGRGGRKNQVLSEREATKQVEPPKVEKVPPVPVWRAKERLPSKDAEGSPAVEPANGGDETSQSQRPVRKMTDYSVFNDDNPYSAFKKLPLNPFPIYDEDGEYQEGALIPS